MIHFLWNIALAVLWMSLQGQFTSRNLLTGYVVGYLLLLILRPVLPPSSYTRKIWQALNLAAYVLWTILIANVQIAVHVLRPRLKARPGVVAFPLSCRTDIEITTLANLINLSPGTLSVDVSPDRSTLYIHVLDVPDPQEFIHYMKDGLERRILEALR